MSVISARNVRLRRATVRYCEMCKKRIVGSAIRLYGMAHTGEPPYTIYLHPDCVHPDSAKHEPKLLAALHHHRHVGDSVVVETRR